MDGIGVPAEVGTIGRPGNGNGHTGPSLTPILEQVQRTCELASQHGTQLSVVERASLLHDVGQFAIRSSILYKTTSLSEEEWAEMRKHPDIGWNMLRQIETLEGAAEIVRAHHEHYDGSGYPCGLRGDEIPRGARIFAVADAFDAITSDRPYRDARSHIVAVEEIMANSGSQFDPQVVESLLRALGYERSAAPDGVAEAGVA